MAVMWCSPRSCMRCCASATGRRLRFKRDGEPGDERLALGGQLAVRDAQDAVAAGLQFRVTAPVTLERLAGAVEREAVDLDGQPLLPPQEVDLIAADALDAGRGRPTSRTRSSMSRSASERVS